MNKHDQVRKDQLIQALRKALERARTCKLYLTVNDRDPDDIAATALALEHIEIALEHLGVYHPAGNGGRYRIGKGYFCVD